MYMRTETTEQEFERLSKLGNKVKYKRTKTVFHFRCDYCKQEFTREKGEVDPKRFDNSRYSHYCKEHLGEASRKGQLSRRRNLDKIIGRRTIDSLGYVSIYVGKEYPYSKPYCCSVREHIKVMEEHLGRPLKRNKKGSRRSGEAEVVHHIDGDKANNKLDNLDLCTVQEHNKCHAVIEEIVFELYKQGQVGYDREAKRYFLKAA